MKEKTPSFIVELPLKTSKVDEKELLSRLDSARKIYNAVLGEAKRRLILVKQSKDYQKARKLTKNKNNSKIKNELFKKSKDFYEFNEYSLHKYVCQLRHKLVNNLDIHTTQKLATRAFQAVVKMMFGKAKKVRFKGYNQFDSFESKNNEAGIRWRDNKVEWNGLSLKSIINIEDEIIRYSLKHKVKYCRLFKKIIKGKNRFYVQLILEGYSYIKDKNKLGKLGNGEVCFDIGPSTIAIVSMNSMSSMDYIDKNNENNEGNKFNAKLLQFCSELNDRRKEITNLQSKIDRQRRQNNPKNYLENGKIKKGRSKWKKSKRQLKNEKELFELHRVVSCHRKSLQGKLANETIRMGRSFKTEKISKKWLQKNYGKSIGISAPGMYVSSVKRKAERAGGSFMEFSTITTKLSQTCVCGKQSKKSLSDRVHSCDCGIYCQRDLLSAFLGLFVEKTECNKEIKYSLQVDQAERQWSSADKLLQAAWGNSFQSTSRGVRPSSFGTFKEFQSQSRSSVKGGKNIIAKFKIQDVVIGINAEESLKANKAFPLEPAGF